MLAQFWLLSMRYFWTFVAGLKQAAGKKCHINLKPGFGEASAPVRTVQFVYTIYSCTLKTQL